MAKDEHLQEFIKLLKEEIKKDRPPRNERFDRAMSKRHLPASMVVQRLAHFSRKAQVEDNWLNLAVTAFEEWERENYPEAPIP
jgi:hypothetical protein